jgi:hypothetical protein
MTVDKGVGRLDLQPGRYVVKLAAKKPDGTEVAAQTTAQVQAGQTTSLTLTAT